MNEEAKTVLHGGPCNGRTVRVRVCDGQWQPTVQAVKMEPLRAFDTYTEAELAAPIHIYTYAAVRMRKDRREWCEYFYMPD